MSLLGRQLHACEDLYEESLKRCSNQEAQRLLLPGTMIPRSLQTQSSIYVEPKLYGDIFAARMRGGDWRNAYLTMDVALRLKPSQPQYRILQTVVKNRPVHEAYQVFFVICQAEGGIRGKELRGLLDCIVRAQQMLDDPRVQLDLAKAVFGAFLASTRTKSAKFDERHLECLVRGAALVIPRRLVEKGGVDGALERLPINWYSVLLELSATAGILPAASFFGSAIASSGRLQNLSLLE